MTDDSNSNMAPAAASTVPPAGGPAVQDAANPRRSVHPRQIMPTQNPFDTAPLYRKRWMVVVSAFVFIPATLVILLSGPVYQNDGVVWDQKKRVTTAIALCVVMVFTFARLFIPSN